jgi:multiple sugar transport system substrate-binding protein
MSARFSRPVSRRELLRVLGVGSAGVLLAACAPQVVEVTKEVPVEVTKEVIKEVAKEVLVKETVVVQPTAAVPAEQGELRVLYCCSTQDDFDKLYIPYGEQFMAAHPGVTVKQELLPAGQNYFEKLQTLYAAGQEPDVMDMWEGYVQPYAARGLFANMDPLIANDPKLQKEDILPVCLEAGSWQGSLYSLLVEFTPGPGILFYNVDLFKKAGLTPPTSDWKWDDMRAAAKALTDLQAKPEQWGLAFDLWFVQWLYYIWSNGGDVFNKDETKSTLDDPKTVEAVQYWADMVTKDKVAITSSELQTMGGGASVFRTGNVGLYLGNAWEVGVMNDARAQGLNWQGTMSPTANDGNRVWYMHTASFSIAAKSKMIQSGWEFARDWIFELEPKRLTGIAAIPAFKQLLYLFATPQNHALGLDPLMALATGTAGLVRVPGAGEKWDKISQIIQAEYDKVFIGDETALEAAAVAGPLVDEELART